MKDFFGNELSVGDSVAFITRHYRDFTKGTVTAFTAQQVRVTYNTNQTTMRYPSALIKKV